MSAENKGVIYAGDPSTTKTEWEANYTTTYDFVDITTLDNKLKYYNGSSWVAKPLKYYNGSSWVRANLKHWDGSQWTT